MIPNGLHNKIPKQLQKKKYNVYYQKSKLSSLRQDRNKNTNRRERKVLNRIMNKIKFRFNFILSQKRSSKCSHVPAASAGQEYLNEKNKLSFEHAL